MLLACSRGLFYSLVIRNVVIFAICGEKKARQMQKGERGEQKMHRKQEARGELGQLQVNKTKGANDDTPPPPPLKKETGKNETKTKTKKASSARLQQLSNHSLKWERRTAITSFPVHCEMSPKLIFLRERTPSLPLYQPPKQRNEQIRRTDTPTSHCLFPRFSLEEGS